MSTLLPRIPGVVVTAVLLSSIVACSSSELPPAKAAPANTASAPVRTIFVVNAAPVQQPPSGPAADVQGAEQDRRNTEQRGRVLHQVEGYYPKIATCYEEARGRKPDLVGRIVITFTAAPSGDVVQTAVAPGSNLDDAQIEACILGVFSAMKFSAWEGKSVTATLPIDLLVKTETLLVTAWMLRR